MSTKTKPSYTTHVRAYRTGLQAGFLPLVYARINFNTINYDLLNEFDETVNFRFQPSHAGYYELFAQTGFTAAPLTMTGLEFVGVGAFIYAGAEKNINHTVPTYFSIYDVEYLTPNDYVEVYAAYNGVPAGNSIFGGRAITFFTVNRLT